MGQELIKYSGAGDLVEKSDHRLVVTAPTANQRRLREMLHGEVSLEQSRCYHPPEMPNEPAEWEIDSAYPITVGSQNTRQLTAARTAEPKACFTGFAFGILCAGAIGVASFLSLATVVAPQPSVAALVPVQLESRSMLAHTELQQQRFESKAENDIHHRSAWQRLSRFHTSAGKFSQPGIRLVSSLEPSAGERGHERAQLPSKQKDARLAHPRRTGILPVKSETSGSPVNQNNGIVQVHLINVVAQEGAPTASETPTVAKEPILFEKRTGRPESVVSYQDTSDLAVEIGSGGSNSPSEPTDAQLVTQASLAPVSSSIKVIRSSLTPTARTKVRLPDSYSTSISRKQRLRKVAKKKTIVPKSGVIGIQARPDWARAAFNSTNN